MQSATEDTALFARRVMLIEELTQKLYETKDLNYLSFLYLWASRSRKKRYSIYLHFLSSSTSLGSTIATGAFIKKHIIEVNGFEEDYVTAGIGEDNDIEWRLVRKGVKVKSIRYSAIKYHLHHPFNYGNDDVQVGYGLLRKKKEENHIRCKNGLEKI